ncbi:endosomal/lysosomal proton channel TMEM175 [Myotis daubentonii]|uniref:endosomal/lysosomal proton channel TMEM175 n=1 Tax=Myotis daubentonii TaxID=98922 RepID=UPI002873C55A|nr:endosomal/lysosomal proton channel TMEM175 [Myotis daubentonii]XP_059534127.1 endosomal/lysosomal proton channel TMEM175 [Myotis daubentonii]XP_059534138.1 endosomal/lysosomal proton channel TMEM175 [Myotis daubentonii]XP_059534145.1 endosomal/lysosomal proton channel TMEM175 [Myotis daubentonii]
MSGSRAPEPALSVQGDSTTSTGDGDEDEDAAHGTQHSHRMLSFSDALLSIIATVMILPVTHTEISPEQFDRSIQKLLATRIAVYLMTFLIVTVAWAAHTRLFQVVGKIDDTLALLNLACMMTITFLPYTFSLMMAFPEVPLGIFLFCVCVIAIGAVQALIVVYAFHLPHLLNPQIGRSDHRGLYRRHILHIVLRGPALCFLAAGFSLFFYPVSYLLMATVIFLPYASKAASWCRGRLVGPREPPAPSVQFFTYDLQEPLSKERVEAFSDGVYAIVATLLILDICEDNVPDAKVVEERFQGSLVAALSVYGPQFLAYFGSFATVGLLWFAHHSLFLHVRKATQSMGLLNTLSLAFVGGLPLAYQQTSAFARQPRDELESVRVSCAIVFFAGIFQFAMWTAALLREAETLRPSARFGGQEHAFMCAKLALYPCASLLAFTLTCVLSRFSTAIFHSMQIAVPFAFLLLRLLVRLALALLRALRGLAAPARDTVDPRAPLLPAPC